MRSKKLLDKRSQPLPTAVYWLNKCAQVVGMWIIVAIGSTAFASVDRGVQVHPSEISVDAMLNEPLVFRVEISSQNAVGEVDILATGVRIQREIKKPDPYRRAFLIELDTSVAGRVSGTIAVVEEDGTVLCTIAVNGEVKPHVHVSPARIFLGSLEYGTTTDKVIEKRFKLWSAEKWRITRVDVSEMVGAKVDITEDNERAKEIRLQICEKHLKAGEPFGAFIKRRIRVYTNLAEQEEISVPLTAMLSNNRTDRDFNTFVFKGNERWQGKWGTPNIAAAVVGPIALLCYAYANLLFRINSRYPYVIWSGVGLLLLLAVAGMYFLVKTYSRGGWVAFLVGFLALMLLMRGHRRSLGAGVAGFVLMISIQPAGVDRAATATATFEDLSVRNRLLVWRGALEMIVDHPQGVGVGKFGECFQDFYQEPWHNGSYSTAVNDYLTLAVEHGRSTLLWAVTVIVILLTASIQLVRRYGDLWLSPVVAAMAVLCSASFFSTLAPIHEFRIMLLVGGSTLVCYCVVRMLFTCRDRRKRSFCLLCTPIMTAIFAVCTVVGILLLADVKRSVRHAVKQGALVASSISSIEYLPATGAHSCGTILFLSSEFVPLTVLGREILRPLAQNGWRAISLSLPMYDQEATDAVTRALRDVNGPILILAEGTKARVALAVERKLSHSPPPIIAFINPVYFCSLQECDQSNQLYPPKRSHFSIPIKTWDACKADWRVSGSILFEILKEALEANGWSRSKIFTTVVDVKLANSQSDEIN